ncbi:MAG TPA: cell division protein FtsK [Rheinheimera sp.]|nr:cell division protein FtsK [Rheinheimera sp.]
MFDLQAKSVFSLNGTQRFVEVGLIAFSGLAVFMLIALLSFDSADPSWSQTGYAVDVKNIAGPVGAQIADMLLCVFGWIAFLFPPFFAFSGYLLFRRFKDLLSLDYLILGQRLLGLLLSVSSACAISSMNFDDLFIYSSGGVVGDLLVQNLLPHLSFAGTTLALLCSFCIGLTLLTGISWLTVADSLGWLVTTGVFSLIQRFKTDRPVASVETTVVVNQASPAKNRFDTERAQATAQAEMPVYQPSDQVISDRVQDSPQRQEPVLQFSDSTDKEEPRIDLHALLTDDDAPVTAAKPIEAPAPSILSYAKAVEPPVVKASPIKIGAEVQSRGFFPTSDQKVEPLPIKPLDAKTEARAFVSIDDVAEEELSFSSIDDTYAADELAQSYMHTQASVAPAASPSLPELETDADEQDEVIYPVKATPATELPSLALLEKANRTANPISQEDLDRVSRLVEVKLLDFGVEAKVVGVHPGPVVTRFELDLAPGVKVSKITGLSKDLARSLSAISVRVVEVIPGKSFIGLELPNQVREIVRLSEVIEDEVFSGAKSHLTMALGKDIAGKAVCADLAKMPHLLVAGTTGSGKSVGVNVMICSLLFKSTPEDVRFLMIDPKMLELSVYEGIPHLLTEVVTDMKEAANGLRWCVGEMERRYKLMSAMGVRNLKGYNAKVEEAIADGRPLRDPLWRPTDDMRGEPPMLEKLPSIVVVIDEFADMMMIVGKKVEELIARIAQKARAAGIHLILATQRPSVDVITGLIKANIPTRMAFQVSSKIDSRTILDQQGAESLLGQGDMLYLPPGSGVPTRVHGAFVDDHEVHAIVADWKTRGKPNYIPDILSGEPTEDSLLPGETMEEDDAEADPLFDQAVAFVTESRKASVSGVQRRFRIGYNRAARLVETMEHCGIVSGPGHNGNREVLAPPPPKGF